MSIIRFGMSQSVSALYLSVIFTFSLFIILNSEAALDISVTDLDGNPAVGVKVQVFNGDIEPSSDVEPIKPPRPRADGLVGFETNADGKASVNVPSGEYTVVAFSSRESHKFVLMQKVTAPGRVHLSATDGAPVTVKAFNAEGEPLVAANVFFRPVKRCPGLVGQIDNDGNLRAYITPGRYHVVLNSAFGLQYLVLPNQRIAGAGDEINFDIAGLPTTEVIFDLPQRAFPAIYEVLETELTYEYVEKIEEVIGYDAAYTNVYSLIGSGPVTLTAGLTYYFNISYVVPFDGAFYAYELRPRPILLSEGVHHIGNTGSEDFRAEISLDKSEYHPEDTVHINYRIIDARDNQMTRYFDYSGARLIFPFVTVRNPDGVVIASNPNTFDFFHFDFRLPNSARLGEYQVEVSMNAQMYGWIGDTTTFNVAARPDTSPPKISQITAPSEAEAGSEITLKADIKDDRSISGVSLNLSHDKATVQNGIVSPWSQSDKRYTFKIPAEFATPGILKWEISATDSAGNKATQAGEPISIKDTSPPIIEHEPIESVEIGVNLKIEAMIKDNVDIADAILYYQLNDGALQTILMISESRYEEMEGWKDGRMEGTAVFHPYAKLPASDIEEFGTLKYFIQASDSAENIAFVPPRTKKEPDFIVAQIVDTIQPTIYHSPVKESEAGVPIPIEALVKDNHAVSAKSVRLNYKSTLEANFNVAPMNLSGGLYSALIPTEATTGTGIEYFIEAADEPDGRGQSRTVRAPMAGENYFITIRPSPDKILSKLEISPRGAPSAPLELEAGTVHSFGLKAYDTSGKPLHVTPIWSAAGGIGFISQRGVFTAARYISGEESGTIIATLAQLDENGKPWQAIAQVQIKPSTPKRLALMPKFARLSAGEQQYFYVAVMDAYDNTIPIGADELSWNVSPHIGSIEIVGSSQPKSAWLKHQRLLFTASKMGSGVVEVKWKSGRLTAVSEVQVEFGGLTRIAISPASAQLVAGQRQQFTAIGFDSQGDSIPIAPLWSVRNGIGTVRADGRFTAGLSGVGAIVATLGDLTAEAPVTVTEGELAKITIDPFIDYLPLSTAKVKRYRQFVAFGWDAAGNPVPIGDLTWQTDKAAGTIDNTGLFTATTERGAPIGNIVINGSVFARGKNNLSAKSVVVIQS
ncbi:MAG: MG2 domain-containing protein, partial [Candidatus Poribacteria bacterium]